MGGEGETDRDRERKTPARLAEKPTPNPLLSLHKPHHTTFHTSFTLFNITSALHAHFFNLAVITCFPLRLDTAAMCMSETVNIKINHGSTLIRMMDG